ncbi:MAG: imidazole glycerol phosphate synthase HisHF, partial [Acidobacteriota bacterium]|nr:imidazole glycerol phosphate synthase HisHF [Acidobacteriota bacterium]
MIKLLDYGAGNLASLEGALEALGYACERAESPADVALDDLWVLPGDGHYLAAQRSLLTSGWWPAL